MNRFTNQACFTDEAAYQAWKTRNCASCKKCVVFNERLKRMPHYQCAIQRDIELQHNEGKGVTQRTLDMVSHDSCPMLRTVVLSNLEQTGKNCNVEAPVPAEAPRKSIRDHIAAAYEDVLLNWEKKYGRQKNAEMFKKAIQDRFCPLLSIPAVTEEDREAHLYVERILKAKTAKDMMEVFKKDIYSVYNNLGYNECKEKAEKDVEKKTEADFNKCLTEEERKRAYFTPQITLDIAMRYAMTAQRLAAEYKIPDLRKLSRELKGTEKWHEENKRDRLDHRLMLMGKRVLYDLLQEGQHDLQILYLSVNQECLRTNPDYPYQDIRCNAVIAKLMLDFLFDFGTGFCKLVAERSHSSLTPYIHAPQVQFLDSAMIAYAGSEDFNYKNPQVQLALKIFTNRIKRIDFSKFYILPKKNK